MNFWTGCLAGSSLVIVANIAEKWCSRWLLKEAAKMGFTAKEFLQFLHDDQ